jgi:hypothetical protein
MSDNRTPMKPIPYLTTPTLQYAILPSQLKNILSRAPTQLPIHHPSQSQHPSTTLPHLLLIFSPPLPPHLRRFHIRRTLVIRFRQHTHHTNQDLLHTLNRTPSFARVFVVIWIISWRVEDGYTDQSRWVHYSFISHVPPFCSSSEL